MFGGMGKMIGKRFACATALFLAGAAGASAQTEIPGITRPMPREGAPGITQPLPLERTPVFEPIPEPKPQCAFELAKEHGRWLVAVKSFRGERETYSRGRFVPDTHIQELAEQFADYIRKTYKINAYVYPRGWVLRQERDVETTTRIKAIKDYYHKQGIEPTAQMLRVKTVSVPDEFTVFVAPARGTLSDREMAIDFANQVRKLSAPPEFNDVLSQGRDNEENSAKGNRFNAFLASMPGMNPMIPKSITTNVETPKADDFLMKLNSGETYSLLHKTRRKWTLLVQTYGGGGTVMQAGANGAGSGEASDRLERAALQAHNVAELLRANKVEAYVMHTRTHSMVFVGDYETGDDRELLGYAGAFAKKQLRDKKTGNVVETFMEKPSPVMIPKP